MKKQINAMYEQITMPPETERKIRSAMEEQRPERSPVRRLAAATAAFVLIISLSPRVRAAVEEWVQKYVFPEVGVTIYEKDDGDTVYVETYYDTETPAFAQVREGRLYFTGNGEELDITEEISEEKPFYYTYENEDGLLVYMVVGMDGTLENFGIYTFIRDQTADLEPWETWITGAGRNFLNPETDTAYPWVETVWDTLEIPWPMPDGAEKPYTVTAQTDADGDILQVEVQKNTQAEK